MVRRGASSPHSIPFAPASPLRRTTGKAGNNVFLKGDEQDQDGDRNNRCDRHQVIPVRCVLTNESVQGNRQRLQIRLGEQGQSEGKFTPRHQEGEGTDHDDTGTNRRDDDSDNGSNDAKSIKSRGLFNFLGELLEEGAQHDDRKG